MVSSLKCNVNQRGHLSDKRLPLAILQTSFPRCPARRLHEVCRAGFVKYLYVDCRHTPT